MSPREPLPAVLRLKSLLALLQLASPGLPIGGFAYSQGLESAIDSGVVHDEASAARWIGDVLSLVIARYEAPMWVRVFDAACEGMWQRFVTLDADLLASRETAELRAESRQMGQSMLRVFPALDLVVPTFESVSFTSAFALACALLGIEREQGLAAYLWAWFENQVLVAVKTLPLGQMAGQRLLFAGHREVSNAVDRAQSLRDDALGSTSLGFAMMSVRHESQYSRLFRS